jgi:hypothetical protein
MRVVPAALFAQACRSITDQSAATRILQSSTRSFRSFSFSPLPKAYLTIYASLHSLFQIYITTPHGPAADDESVSAAHEIPGCRPRIDDQVQDPLGGIVSFSGQAHPAKHVRPDPTTEIYPTTTKVGSNTPCICLFFLS